MSFCDSHIVKPNNAIRAKTSQWNVCSTSLDATANPEGPCRGFGFVVRIIKNGLFPILQIGIPIILIVLGTLDLGKAVISSDDKAVFWCFVFTRMDIWLILCLWVREIGVLFCRL